ncbi:hypothetical protein M885DRAFT_587874 [Pelagophyceae sp. CCMP2097]|nr:hypothetical protein M885DRAFT_587874 [Pelagophyceae sp. CCMP2097]
MALLRRGLRLSGAALAACGSRAARLDEDAAPREATFGVDAVPEAVLPMVLKKPTDEVVFKKPNVDELKMRLATVAAEMEERSRWEAVRVHALLEQVEGSAAKQCAALLRAEADAAGAESAARLSAQRAADAIELEIAVDAKRAANDDKFGALLEAHERATRAEWAAKLEAALAAADGAAQARLEADLDEWTAASAAAALDRAAAAEDIGRELEACFAQIEHKMLEHESQAALHRSTLVVLRCIDALNSQRPADKAVAAARGAGDDVVAAALGPLTPASLKRGVPDLAQLERRFFGAVKGHTARWLMVPDGMDGDVLGHAIGAVLATPLLSNPTRTSLGGPTEPLAALDEAAAALKVGNLSACVLALRKVDRPNAKTVNPSTDWLDDAQARLRADQAARLLRARLALVNAAAGRGQAA